MYMPKPLKWILTLSLSLFPASIVFGFMNDLETVTAFGKFLVIAFAYLISLPIIYALLPIEMKND
jgi:hypothetical protein